MDAELVCVNHLNGSGIGATAYYDRPSACTGPLVVVERTGGGRGEGETSRPVVDVQCWAPTRPEAYRLACAAESALVDMPGAVDDVTHVTVSSVFRDRDLETGTPRYHIVCEIYSNT